MNKARRTFAQILLLIISAVGLLSALLLLTDPPSTELSGVTGLFAMNSAVMASQRGLASLEAARSQVPEAALLEINCTEMNQMLETASPRFRLKGPICVPQDLSVTSTKVSNKTNGYVATVFHHSSQFTTDYINLKEGRNDIDVKFLTEKGAIQKTITVIRNFPSLKAGTAQN